MKFGYYLHYRNQRWAQVAPPHLRYESAGGNAAGRAGRRGGRIHPPARILPGQLAYGCYAVLHEMRQVQNDPAAWKDLYLCGGDAESVRDPFRLVRQAHAEWSDRQFGNVGPVGPLKHLAKEANEAAEAPDDISEFADIIMLVWDATRRAGITDKQLAVAVEEKLERNKRRQWGSVKDGEPCHHLKN
ncbi:hypothetical protein [Klebsiella phage vB_KshKPC-M]|nr:hypothetical protein [Klebsiella phage vB_KshKPC-M]